MISRNPIPPFILFLLLLLFGELTDVAAARDTASALINFNVENGLPSNNVYSCIQDHNGYIWMATDNGVVKYNGYTFKMFTTTDGLPSNDVWRLVEDSKGRIWVHSHAYTFGYIRNDKYTTVYSSERQIDHTQFTESNNLVLFYDFDLLVAIDSNDGVFKIPLWKMGQNNYYLLADDAVLYKVTTASTIHSYNLKTLRQHTNVHCDLTMDSLFSVFTSTVITNDGKLIGPRWKKRNELLMFDILNCTFQSSVFNNEEHIYITCVRNDKPKQGYYLFTDKNLYVLNRKFKTISTINYASELPPNTQVSYMYVDSFKSQWFSSLNSGVWMKPEGRTLFLKDALLNGSETLKLIGVTSDGSTYWWDKDHNELQIKDVSFHTIYTAYIPYEIVGIGDLDSGSVMLSTRAAVYKFTKGDKKLEDFFNNKEITFIESKNIPHHKWSIARRSRSDSAKYFYMSNLRSMHKYRNGKIYATGSAGPLIFSIDKDSMLVNKLDYERIANLLYDRSNDLYFFYNEGKIIVMNPANDDSLVFRTQQLKSIGINYVLSIKADAYHNIYILADNALLVFNPVLMKLQYHRLNFDLAKATMVVYKNTLVIASKSGVAFSYIRGPANLSGFEIAMNPRYYYYRQINKFVINKFGTAFLQTDRGVYTFEMDSLLRKQAFKKAAGQDFTKFIIHCAGKSTTLSRNDTVVLPIDNGDVSFDLINFYGSDNRKFFYRINNSGDWVTTTSGELFYKWKAGAYYRIECVVEDDTWKSNPYVFYIMQTPHWWQTGTWTIVFWASGIMFFIILIIISVLVTRYYSAKANEKKQALTNLELRALYAQINPHFIFNTLVSAQYFISGKKMEEAYAHINKFSRLLRSYLKASGNRYANLGEEIDLLRDYIELQQVRFEYKFDYAIKVDNKVAKDSMLIPSLLLQPLVENAINHGLFHLPQEHKGFLTLQFLQGTSSEELVCIIEDNGVGRARSKEINNENTLEKDTSYGTTLTKKLIDIFKEYEKMDIYLEYIDKPSPETGTIVKLTIGNIKYVA